eukprot:Rmarinus@m.14521
MLDTDNIHTQKCWQQYVTKCAVTDHIRDSEEDAEAILKASQRFKSHAEMAGKANETYDPYSRHGVSGSLRSQAYGTPDFRPVSIFSNPIPCPEPVTSKRLKSESERHRDGTLNCLSVVQGDIRREQQEKLRMYGTRDQTTAPMIDQFQRRW